MAGLRGLPDHEPVPTLEDAQGRPAPLSEVVCTELERDVTELAHTPQSGPETQLLLVGDSFSRAMLPFLAQGAGRVAWAHNLKSDPNAVMTWIDTLKPRLIVLEIVERQVDDVAEHWRVRPGTLAQKTPGPSEPQAAR